MVRARYYISLNFFIPQYHLDTTILPLVPVTELHLPNSESKDNIETLGSLASAYWFTSIASGLGPESLGRFVLGLDTMVLCGNDLDPFDFQSQCVREIWGSFLPAGLVLVLCFLSIPIPHALDILCSPFKPYLSLHEAEALDGNIGKISSNDELGDSVETVPLWRTMVFVFVGIIECLSWTAHGSYRLYNDPRDVFGGVLPFLVAIAWLYTIIRLISHPIATSPFDLFSIYLTLFCVGSLRIGGILFDHNVFGSPWPSTITLVALSANLLALLVLLIVVLKIPLALPSNRINKKDIVS